MTGIERKSSIENNEKFPHLWKMPPEIKSITDLNPHDVDSKHLSFLDDHLEWLQTQFPDIAEEIDKTREKIKIAMSGAKNIVSWEAMQAANNPEYKNFKREYRSLDDVV